MFEVETPVMPFTGDLLITGRDILTDRRTRLRSWLASGSPNLWPWGTVGYLMQELLGHMVAHGSLQAGASHVATNLLAAEQLAVTIPVYDITRSAAPAEIAAMIHAYLPHLPAGVAPPMVGFLIWYIAGSSEITPRYTLQASGDPAWALLQDALLADTGTAAAPLTMASEVDQLEEVVTAEAIASFFSRVPAASVRLIGTTANSADKVTNMRNRAAILRRLGQMFTCLAAVHDLVDLHYYRSIMSHPIFKHPIELAGLEDRVRALDASVEWTTAFDIFGIRDSVAVTADLTLDHYGKSVRSHALPLGAFAQLFALMNPAPAVGGAAAAPVPAVFPAHLQYPPPPGPTAVGPGAWSLPYGLNPRYQSFDPIPWSLGAGLATVHACMAAASAAAAAIDAAGGRVIVDGMAETSAAFKDLKAVFAFNHRTVEPVQSSSQDVVPVLSGLEVSEHAFSSLPASLYTAELPVTKQVPLAGGAVRYSSHLALARDQSLRTSEVAAAAALEYGAEHPLLSFIDPHPFIKDAIMAEQFADLPSLVPKDIGFALGEVSNMTTLDHIGLSLVLKRDPVFMRAWFAATLGGAAPPVSRHALATRFAGIGLILHWQAPTAADAKLQMASTLATGLYVGGGAMTVIPPGLPMMYGYLFDHLIAGTHGPNLGMFYTGAAPRLIPLDEDNLGAATLALYVYDMIPTPPPIISGAGVVGLIRAGLATGAGQNTFLSHVPAHVAGPLCYVTGMGTLSHPAPAAYAVSRPPLFWRHAGAVVVCSEAMGNGIRPKWLEPIDRSFRSVPKEPSMSAIGTVYDTARSEPGVPSETRSVLAIPASTIWAY